MKKYITIVIVLVVVLVGAGSLFVGKKELKPAASFEECAALGNPIMESYPRQCRSGEKTFTEEIGNTLDKADLIRLDSPRPNETITSPVVLKGEARGTWFFEASFPVFVVDWDGRIIGQGIATAKENWMTEDFVPFEATVTFTVDPQVYSNRGSLILRKDNPSGLPEHDDALEVPVLFNAVTSVVPPGPVACTMEAKLCPDGSYVSRTGPNCEFGKCPVVNSLMSEAEARVIAEKSCVKGGEVLGPGTYNPNSKTWWYDANLNATKPGCNPACVVSEETKKAEINWRCTGLRE